MPAISVLIPVYNVEQYLAKCIESVLKQDFQDWDMILVDDGSPDNSGAICDEYAKRDSRIKVVHKENGGLISARKEGFIHSRGKYLVFLDSDDTLSDGALSILYNNIIKGYDVVKGCAIRTDNKGNIISQEHFKFSEGIIKENKDILIKFFNGDISPYLWGGIYKKDLFTTDIFDKGIKANISFGEDWLTNILIARNIQKMLCIKDIVYNYYINNESITNSQVVSVTYFKRMDDVLINERIIDKYTAEERFCKYCITSFFQPEIGFCYKEYNIIKNLIKDNKWNIRNLVEQKFLYFFYYMPLYNIYVNIYCLLYYIFKLHCKQRKILT